MIDGVGGRVPSVPRALDMSPGRSLGIKCGAGVFRRTLAVSVRHGGSEACLVW